MIIHSYEHYGSLRAIPDAPGTIIQELTRARIVSISTASTGEIEIRGEETCTKHAYLSKRDAWRLVGELIRVILTGWHPYKAGVYDHAYWADENQPTKTNVRALDLGPITIPPAPSLADPQALCPCCGKLNESHLGGRCPFGLQ